MGHIFSGKGFCMFCYRVCLGNLSVENAKLHGGILQCLDGKENAG